MKIKLNSSDQLTTYLKKYNEIILEEYISGQEIQVAVINGKSLGAIELIPRRFFMITRQNIPKKQKQTRNASKATKEKIY